MLVQVVLCSMVASIGAHPGFDYPEFGPIFHEPLLSAPVLPAAPVIKAFPAPILAPAPVIKAVAPVPVVKAILPPPATSYASVIKYNTFHPVPVLKTVVVPQPIIKDYYPQYSAPLALGHGYH